MNQSLYEYCLRLGDTPLILSQRIGEYCSKAPHLEEDLAKKDQKIVQMSNLNKELIQDKRNAKQLQTASVALPGQGRKKNKREKKKGGKKQFGQQAL